MTPAKLSHRQFTSAIAALAPNGEEHAAVHIFRMLHQKNDVPTSIIAQECQIRNVHNIASLANRRLEKLGLFISSTKPPTFLRNQSRESLWNIYRIPKKTANDPIRKNVTGE